MRARVIYLFLLIFVAIKPLVVSAQLIDQNTKEVDMDLLGKMLIVSDYYKFSLAHYIPLRGLPENDDGNVIARRIFRHSLQNFIDRYKDNNSPVLVTAANLNNNLNTKISAQGNMMTMRFKPFEAEAEVTYQGPIPVQTKYVYEVSHSESRLEISKIYGDKTYAYTYADDDTQSSNIIGVRWSW